MIKNSYPGKFITFEGIDGSGKSDQFRMAREFLKKFSKVNVIFTKEPPNNVVGVEIYDILRGYHPSIKFENLSELEMQRKYFLARRMQYQDVNLPALKSGVNVISDRGLVSVAYGIKDINELNKFMTVQKNMFREEKIPFIVPDLNLIYDVPVDVALKRLGKKNRKNDKFEQKRKLETARANYLAIGQKIPNCIIVDGTMTIDNVFKETKKHVANVLGLKI